MGRVFDEIDDRLASWIRGQQMFFVATAPEAGGHINLSPKGPIQSLQVLDPHTIAYLDLIGSGAETVAHLRQNGRICVMLCAFQGPPRILRMHGRGTVLEPGRDRYDRTAEAFDLAAIPAAEHAARSIVLVELQRIADSCGFDVPLMVEQGRRPQRGAWVDNKLAKGGQAALAEYVAEHNAESIDGLPALPLGAGELRA
jgi:Pyridoxamine 5'-phosphate oxidase